MSQNLPRFFSRIELLDGIILSKYYCYINFSQHAREVSQPLKSQKNHGVK